MSRRTVAFLLVPVALAMGAVGYAQTQRAAGAQAELKKLADEFMQAWAKGDAKALAALHTADAIRLPGDGRVVTGRAAIEQNFGEGLAGVFKGSTLTITPGESRQVAPDVYVGEGRYSVSGGNPPPGVPTSGQYLNTFVRQGGRWLLASSAVISPPAR